MINVSRGALIDTKALIEALKSGRSAGWRSSYEEEEGIFFEDLSGQILQNDELARLLTFPNVLITAHQAFLTHEALAEIARVTVENLRAVFVRPSHSSPEQATHHNECGFMSTRPRSPKFTPARSLIRAAIRPSKPT